MQGTRARAATRAAQGLEDPDDASAVNSAIRDYRILLERFGEHESVLVGEPIDLSILT